MRRKRTPGTTLAGLRLIPSSAASILSPLSPFVPRSRQPPNRTLIMKIERFAGHREAREALVLSVVGVTTIMLIANLILLILY